MITTCSASRTSTVSGTGVSSDYVPGPKSAFYSSTSGVKTFHFPVNIQGYCNPWQLINPSLSDRLLGIWRRSLLHYSWGYAPICEGTHLAITPLSHIAPYGESWMCANERKEGRIDNPTTATCFCWRARLHLSCYILPFCNPSHELCKSRLTHGWICVITSDIQLPHSWATFSGDLHASLLQQPGPHTI